MNGVRWATAKTSRGQAVVLPLALSGGTVVTMRLSTSGKVWRWRGWATDMAGQRLEQARPFVADGVVHLYLFDGSAGLDGGQVQVDAILPGGRGWRKLAVVTLAK